METSARFQVVFPGEQGVSDVLGLWQVKAGTDLDTSGGMLWRADLPFAPEEAGQALSQRRQELQQASHALEDAPARLTYDLDRLVRASSQPRGLEQVAFDLNTSPSKSAGVLERAWLYRLDAASFGDAVDTSEVDTATGVIAAFCSQVQRLVGQLALVETTNAGWRQAITRVAWNGNVDTWIALSTSRAQPWQHQEVLRQALATRQAWLRFLLLFSSGAVRIGAALAAPAFLPLTLWSTWKYLQQIVEEYRQLARPARPV